MKKLLAFVLTLVLLSAMTTAVIAEDNKVIAGVVFQEDQFMKMLAAGYAAAAADMGYEIQQANTNNDQSREAEFINTYAAQGIAGVAISPMNTQVTPAILEPASKEGLVISICNASIDAFPYAVAAFSADNFTFCNQTGQNAVTYLQANFPADKVFKAGVVQFKTQVPEQSKDRVDGFFTALDEAGISYEIVSDQDAWLQDMAVAKVGDMLAANPDLDFIYAANDGGTVGSVMAVDNAGLSGQVVVFGTDASEQIVDLLRSDNNILQAVTGQDPYQIGYKTVTALIQAIEGKEVEGGGQSNIIAGIPLVRGDEEALDNYLVNLADWMK